MIAVPAENADRKEQEMGRSILCLRPIPLKAMSPPLWLNDRVSVGDLDLLWEALINMLTRPLCC